MINRMNYQLMGSCAEKCHRKFRCPVYARQTARKEVQIRYCISSRVPNLVSLHTFSAFLMKTRCCLCVFVCVLITYNIAHTTASFSISHICNKIMLFCLRNDLFLSLIESKQSKWLHRLRSHEFNWINQIVNLLNRSFCVLNHWLRDVVGSRDNHTHIVCIVQSIE